MALSTLSTFEDCDGKETNLLHCCFIAFQEIKVDVGKDVIPLSLILSGTLMTYTLSVDQLG